jgi:hypothetical protein
MSIRDRLRKIGERLKSVKISKKHDDTWVNNSYAFDFKSGRRFKYSDAEQKWIEIEHCQEE